MSQTARGKRGAYRKDYREKLDALEAKRKAAGITRAEWAVRSLMDPARLSRTISEGKAFAHTIATLTHALRELSKEKGRAAALFERGN